MYLYLNYQTQNTNADLSIHQLTISLLTTNPSRRHMTISMNARWVREITPGAKGIMQAGRTCTMCNIDAVYYLVK